MQLDKIVVGIDFSDASLAAARWAARSLAPGGQLLLVHVLPEPFAPVYLRTFVDPALDQLATYTPGLYGALRGFGDALRDDRVRVGVRTGNPAATLARVADEVKADMLCVGRGGGRQGGSRFGATTPQRLLAHARVPVLIMPGPNDDPKARSVVGERIIAAVDARPGGDLILDAAASLASSWGMELEAVHVIEAEARAHSVSRYVGRLASNDRRKVPAAQARRVGIEALGELGLTSLADEWLTSKLADVEGGVGGKVSVRWGDPGPELVSYAQQSAALLVVGRESSRSPVVFAGNFPSGSTTRYVVWSAPCPVLVLPPVAAKATQRLRAPASLQAQPLRKLGTTLAATPALFSARRHGAQNGSGGDDAA